MAMVIFCEADDVTVDRYMGPENGMADVHRVVCRDGP
jgi:hypothetical protein